MSGPRFLWDPLLSLFSDRVLLYSPVLVHTHDLVSASPELGSQVGTISLDFTEILDALSVYSDGTF